MDKLIQTYKSKLAAANEAFRICEFEDGSCENLEACMLAWRDAHDALRRMSYEHASDVLQAANGRLLRVNGERADALQELEGAVQLRDSYSKREG